MTGYRIFFFQRPLHHNLFPSPGKVVSCTEIFLWHSEVPVSKNGNCVKRKREVEFHCFMQLKKKQLTESTLRVLFCFKPNEYILCFTHTEVHPTAMPFHSNSLLLLPPTVAPFHNTENQECMRILDNVFLIYFIIFWISSWFLFKTKMQQKGECWTKRTNVKTLNKMKVPLSKLLQTLLQCITPWPEQVSYQKAANIIRKQLQG